MMTRKTESSLLLGTHVSIAGGYDKAPGRAAKLGDTALQLFCRNPRGWKLPVPADESVAGFVEARARLGIKKVVVHATYLINMATDDPDLLTKGLAALQWELSISARLGADYFVIHPGSAKGGGHEAAIARVAALLDIVLATRTGAPKLLLENTVGSGGHLGGVWSELAAIRQQSQFSDRIGYCYDTCHAFAAGHTLDEPGLREVEAALGWSNIPVVHLNDSVGAFGSAKDRHAHIGRGQIGPEKFAYFLQHPLIAGKTLLLETPDGLQMDPINLLAVKSLRLGDLSLFAKTP